MGRYINIGIMQSGDCASDFESCMERIKRDVEELMEGMNRPELIVGTEMALGRHWESKTKGRNGDTIPGATTEALSQVAKEYGIYFMPGSMLEKAEKDGKKCYYNSVPIFGPDGEMIDVYRKMCPYYPVEGKIEKGDRYVTFDIKEKGIKIGVLNCHDMCFPEISRNLALMGAEVLIRPAMDPEGLYRVCKTMIPTRAVENQAYFLSINCAGKFLGSYAYGHSMVAAPDGTILYEAENRPISLTLTLDVDRVSDARLYGTNYTDQFLRQLKAFELPMPYAESIKEAPLYENLPDADKSMESRAALFAKGGLMDIGRK